jgi:isorenieratene synthase
VIEPLRKALMDAGAEVMTGTRLERVQTEEGKLSGVVVRRGGRRTRWRCKNLILGLDPAGIAGVRGEALQETLSGYARPTGVGSTVVRLWYTGAPDEKTPWNGLFADGPMHNYFWLHRWMHPFDEWYRRTGGGVIEVHLYGKSHQDARDLEDEVLLKQIDHAVGWAWPQVGLRVAGHVLRNPETHPLFSPGVLSRLPPVDPGLEGVSLCGDWIQCSEPVLYLERACMTGVMAAHHAAKRLEIDPRRLPSLVSLESPSPSVHGMRSLLRRFPKQFFRAR